jgi:hypothetical protein
MNSAEFQARLIGHCFVARRLHRWVDGSKKDLGGFDLPFSDA